MQPFSWHGRLNAFNTYRKLANMYRKRTTTLIFYLIKIMKIYDCFMYYDEDELLDLRLNILDEYVDKFIITESKFTHSGKVKNNNFRI